MATTPLQEMGQNDGHHNLLRPAVASGFGIGDVTPEIVWKEVLNFCSSQGDP